jgi:hypothetical protein
MQLDAAIGQVFAPYCPGRCHGHQFWCKKLSCDIVKLLSEVSIQKAQNGPSTQLIKATSCIERLDVTIKTEYLSYFASYQMLTTGKLGKVTNHHRSLLKSGQS